MPLSHKLGRSLAVAGLALLLVGGLNLWGKTHPQVQPTEASFLRWAEFPVPVSALKKALNQDIAAHKKGQAAPWVDTLAYLATQYGGEWGRYRSSDMDALFQKLQTGDTVEALMKDNRYYPSYKQAYDAVLGGFVGEFQKEVPDPSASGGIRLESRYGLKVYHPLAEGYGYSHYDDFGTGRSYGYRRRHEGHDLMGTVGTPVVAVESGRIEHVGWNQYGGWRLGIRSLDGKRYLYYAHLRKDHPYNGSPKEGDIVKAGEVIGYLGMTGYSTTENVNGMHSPHLHFGVQLIFDESQAEENEIWIDCYALISLLEQNRSTVVRDEESREYFRKYDQFDETFPGGLD